MKINIEHMLGYGECPNCGECFLIRDEYHCPFCNTSVEDEYAIKSGVLNYPESDYLEEEIELF